METKQDKIVRDRVDDGGPGIGDSDLKKRKLEEESSSSTTNPPCVDGVIAWKRRTPRFTGIFAVDIRKGAYDTDEEEEEEEEWVYLPKAQELEDKDRGEASKFTKKEVDMVALEPHEYQNIPLSEEEKEYYESRRRRLLQLRKDNGDPFLLLENPHSMTAQEYKIYIQQDMESEGFDIPFMPLTGIPGGKVRVDFTSEQLSMTVAKYSKLALRYYNNGHGTGYVFEHIEKANVAVTGVLIYHITFMAKFAAHSNLSETFQAKVHQNLKGNNIDVVMCRIKP